MTDWDNDGIDMDDTAGEDIIELTDIVIEASDSGAEDDIIELTDIVKKEEMDFNLDIVRVETDNQEEEFDTDLEFEANETLPQMAGNDDEGLLKFTSLTSEQVEAALEKIIEKQFADKIQTILFQVVEKIIEREIAGIRESLQKDLDQIGNV